MCFEKWDFLDRYKGEEIKRKEEGRGKKKEEEEGREFKEI